MLSYGVAATPSADLGPPLRFAPWKNSLSGECADGGEGGLPGPRDSQQSVGQRAIRDRLGRNYAAVDRDACEAVLDLSRVTGLKVAAGPDAPTM